MTKSASIAIICVICAIALFFGVCSCLPGGLEYGDYNVYNAAVNLIQGDAMFCDSVVATYKVKLDDEASIDDVVSVLKSRLGNMYGRYFSDVVAVSNDKISITVSKTVNEEKTSELSILSSVTTTGKVEVTKSTTYSEDDVVLTSDHIAGMSIQRFANGSQSYYIVNMRLTKEGKAIAADKLTMSSTGWSAYLAIDGTVSYGIVYSSDSKLQVYTNSNDECQRIVGLVNSGVLGAKLTALDTEEVTSYGGLIFAIVMAAIILGSWIFYAVRYKNLAVAPIVSQLLAVVVFIMFAGLVYFNLLNVASAIGIVLGYGLMSFFTIVTFDKFQALMQEKTLASARHRAFSENVKWNCIVHAIVLVVGVILWLIPTGVTAPLGNALVYSAVLSFVVTMGLNRLFSTFNLGLDNAKNKKASAK